MMADPHDLQSPAGAIISADQQCVTVANHPRHPSRLPNDQPLIDWPTS